MTGSILNAPPMVELFCLWGGYGPVNGARTLPKARLWLLAESAAPDAPLVARVGWNHPQGGQAVYEDVGGVSTARIRNGRWIEIILFDGTKLGQVLAPCVCGAGAIGYAGPSTGRHYVTMVNAQAHERVRAG